MSDPITCASGKTHNQINNWRGATLKWQLLFIDLFLQVEIERCKLQVNEISWVRFFSSNTVNNCCPLMHILVLLQANFLNINKKPIQMKRKPWELVQNFLPHSRSNQRNIRFRSERKGDSLICSSISPSGITERSELTKLKQIKCTRWWYFWLKKKGEPSILCPIATITHWIIPFPTVRLACQHISLCKAQPQGCSLVWRRQMAGVWPVTYE